jgi:hypothetical protein
MNKEIILHIGLHKTGTSAIQSFLSLNIENLKCNGIYMPNISKLDIGKPNFHHILASDLKNASVKQTNQTASKLYSESSVYPRVLLSSEMLFEPGIDLVLIKNVFLVYFSTVKVILYLRRQDELYISVYNEMVKSGLQERFDKSKFNYYEYNFYKIISELEQVFGKENLILGFYHSGIKLENNLYNDFISKINLNESKNEWNYPSKTVNVSYNIETIEFLRLLNIIFNQNIYLKCNHLILDFIKNIDIKNNQPPSSLLSYNERVSLLSTVKTTNDLVCVEYFNNNYGLFNLLKDEHLTKSNEQYVSKYYLECILSFFQYNYNDFFKEIGSYLKISNSLNNSELLIFRDIYYQLSKQ